MVIMVHTQWYATCFDINGPCLADEPKVFLSFGKSLDPDNIKEGNDVYFECDVKANPKVYKIVWLHNVSRNTTRKVKNVYCHVSTL